MSILDLFHKIESERERTPQAGPPEWIITGLGNPGGKYELTRHNAGFLALDTLASKYKITVNNLKFKALCGQGLIGCTRVLLLKPQTFMNLSGESIFEAASFYKIPLNHILVLYDDVALPLGKVRVRQKGSAGGHNGIKNIIHMCKTDIFPRIKLGVGSPPHPDFDMIDWVLGTFSQEDQKALASAIDRAISAVPILLSDGCEKAASQVN